MLIVLAATVNKFSVREEKTYHSVKFLLSFTKPLKCLKIYCDKHTGL